MNETATMNPTVEKLSKTSLILAAFKAKGLDSPSSQIVEFVKSNSGVEVGVSLVNNLRHRLRKAKEARVERKRRRKPETPQAPPVNDVLAQLLAVKELAAKVGGLEALKSLVSKLEQLAV